MGFAKRWDVGYTLLLLVWAAWILNQLNWNVVPPLMPAIVEEYSLTKMQGGLLMSLVIGPYVVMQFLMGVLSVKFNKAKIIVLGIVGFSISTFMTGLAPSFNGILILRVVTGIFDGFHFVPSQVLIMKYFSAKNRGWAAGIFFTAVTIGGILGSVIAPLITVSAGWRLTFFIIAIPGSILAVICWKTLTKLEHENQLVNPILDEPRSISHSNRQPKKRVWTFPLIVLSFSKTLLSFMSYGLTVFIPLYLVTKYEMNIVFAGLAFGASSIITLATTPLGGLLTRRFNARRLLIATTISSSLSYLVLLGVIYLMPYNLVGFLFFAYVTVITRAATAPPAAIYLNVMVEPSHIDMSFGVWNGIGLIGIAVAPVLMGYSADILGFDGTFFLFGLSAIASIILVLMLPKFPVLTHRTK